MGERKKENLQMCFTCKLHFYCAEANQSSTVSVEFYTISLVLKHGLYIFILNFYVTAHLICT
jgi:hypothetical protein